VVRDGQLAVVAVAAGACSARGGQSAGIEIKTIEYYTLIDERIVMHHTGRRNGASHFSLVK
jgi:hypothetical protein